MAGVGIQPLVAKRCPLCSRLSRLRPAAQARAGKKARHAYPKPSGVLERNDE